MVQVLNNFLGLFDDGFLLFLLKLGSAVLFSFIIGLERELTGHKGSIKTNVLICLGACIFTSYEVLLGLQDVRMAANVITGVGFLCSGFIFKQGLTVSGLGTASTLWCSAGVGILTSRGFLREALFISCALFILNLILAKVKVKSLKAFDDSKTNMLYTYNIVCLKDVIDDVKKIVINNILETNDVNLEALNVKTITEDKVRVVVDLKADNANISDIDNILNGIEKLNGILSTGWKQEEN